MKMGRYVLAAVLTFSATVALAQQTTTMPKTGQSTYGSAGCGLGSMVFGDQAGMVQILAATTNGIGGQTFAITSGTSNCGQAAVGTKGAQLFIEANKEALAKDAARGSGETITTLSHLAGCKDAKAVATKLQQQYTAVFAAGSKDEVVVQKVLSTLKSDAALACHELS